jgi:hypothetical protein
MMHIRIAAFSLFPLFLLVSAPLVLAGDECRAPELVCKAASNQDRSLYIRDHSRYEQRIRIERFKLKGSEEKMEEIRETTGFVQPAQKPDESGRWPVEVKVISDTDKNGKLKNRVDPNATTFLSFGAVMDLAFFPLLPEKLNDYDFQEIVAERKNERWFRFNPKPTANQQALAAGVAMLDQQTGEILTIRIERLHNLEKLDKNAKKMISFYATIDYSQFDGVLRMPTLASGGGESEISRFNGKFRFRFEEGKYRLVAKVE